MIVLKIIEGKGHFIGDFSNKLLFGRFRILKTWGEQCFKIKVFLIFYKLYIVQFECKSANIAVLLF